VDDGSALGGLHQGDYPMGITPGGLPYARADIHDQRPRRRRGGRGSCVGRGGCGGRGGCSGRGGVGGGQQRLAEHAESARVVELRRVHRARRAARPVRRSVRCENAQECTAMTTVATAHVGRREGAGRRRKEMAPRAAVAHPASSLAGWCVLISKSTLPRRAAAPRPQSAPPAARRPPPGSLLRS
jgi:hypothetical protein